ncbi:hypothetical protein QOZ95_005576 [Paenibacillus brasilensis]|uniref:Uncharacterized protein n=1 Tax=Paenibacillus brasilensis TaxID=128574 RepID=A0ABU0L7R9_9BACL|nr:hypothetical protein [Paenibacillus brasilensis]
MNEEKEVKVSKTDPDSGYMIRDGKPEGFFYLDHRTVDMKYNLITDVHVTPGNVHDSVPYCPVWIAKENVLVFKSKPLH